MLKFIWFNHAHFITLSDGGFLTAAKVRYFLIKKRCFCFFKKLFWRGILGFKMSGK
jgi:hypothetical protein